MTYKDCHFGYQTHIGPWIGPVPRHDTLLSVKRRKGQDNWRKKEEEEVAEEGDEEQEEKGRRENDGGRRGRSRGGGGGRGEEACTQ